MADAEIIAVGSELLTPQRLDTNSLYLTDQLNALGVEVVRKTVVGDERERLTDSILGAAARSKIVVLTGGLGPPEDVLTRDGGAPGLEKLLPPQGIRKRWLRTVGMGESDLDQLISPVYKRYTDLATTILAVSGEIHIHLRARCSSAEEAETLVAQASAEIEPLLGDRVYSCNGDSLEKVIGDLLRARH